MSKVHNRPVSLPLIGLLAALGPLSVDTYLPAIERIANDLQQPIHLIEQSIATFVIGYAVGLFIGGIVSDYRGRKVCLFYGLSIFFVTSLLLMQAGSFLELNIYRILQAIGASMATVVGPAIVRDTYEGNAMAKAFTFIGLITLMAPLLSPAIGTGILLVTGWEIIFLFLALYGLLVSFLFWKFIPETRRGAKETIHIGSALKRYKMVLTNRIALPYLLSMPLAFGCMFVFITESAFIYLSHFEQSEKMFPLLFALNIVTMLVFNRFNRFFLSYYTPLRLLKIGLFLQWLGVLGLLIHGVFFSHYLPGYLPLIMLSVGSLGLVIPNLISTYLSFFYSNTTMANATLSTIQFLGSGVIALVATLMHNGKLSTIASVMFFCSTSALLIILFVAKTTLDNSRTGN